MPSELDDRRVWEFLDGLQRAGHEIRSARQLLAVMRRMRGLMDYLQDQIDGWWLAKLEREYLGSDAA